MPQALSLKISRKYLYFENRIHKMKRKMIEFKKFVSVKIL